eukprot:scaffold89175_cov55-Phaeocystis_antarctica.AAC.3
MHGTLEVPRGAIRVHEGRSRSRPELGGQATAAPRQAASPSCAAPPVGCTATASLGAKPRLHNPPTHQAQTSEHSSSPRAGAHGIASIAKLDRIQRHQRATSTLRRVPPVQP